ncbi:MAG: PASTA domain-containing protein, partial [Chloroflexi bacterium]|nr:PASTA domain-containing protein [Chloroflexota bacterium]
MSDTNVILRGRFRERLLDGDQIIFERAWQSNLIVTRALDLLAGLLMQERASPQTPLRGILYWAVGEGDAAWDTNAPNADAQTTRLVREIYRKRLDPVRDISYNPATRTISLRVAFGPDQGAGTLREFGIFGGDATGVPDSGYLINYKIHAPIDKTLPRVLERQLEFTIGPTPNIVVPDLAGLNETQARQNLDQAKLAVGAIDSIESENAAGTVLAQTPSAGTTVAEGIAVNVTLAKPITVGVPDLTGLTPEAAGTALAAASLQLSAVAPSTIESDAPAGTIVSQTPAANARAPRNSQVAIVVAIPRTVVIPDVGGLTIDVADAAVSRAHLQINPVRLTQERSDVAPGVVIAQAPAAGVRVNVGTSVQVTLSATPTVLVPDLTGLLPEAAKQNLSGAGLRLGGITSEPNSATAGTVFKQNPSSGERVPRESTVDIVVASPLPVVTPNLVGMTLAQATQAIQALGLTMTAEPEHQPSHQPAETIIAQEPAAGTQTAQAAHVRVTLATAILTFVPDLVGKTYELARELLKSNLLGLAEPPTEVETPDVPPGTVLAQQPVANEQVAEGTLVALTVATLVRVTVPNLVGQTRAQAEALLQQLGLALNPQVNERTTDVLGDDGRVAEQTPAPDTRVLPGSTVEIVLWNVPRVTVPSLLGLSQPEAKAALESVGLVLDPQTLSQNTSNQADVGRVAAQSLAAGATALKGSVVQITLWQLAQIAVPNLIGLDEASALRILTESGLNPRRANRLVTDATQAGFVLDQKPAAGALLSPGAAVAFGVGVIAAFPELRCLLRDEAAQSIKRFADEFGIEWDGNFSIVHRASFEKPDSVVDQIPAT